MGLAVLVFPWPFGFVTGLVTKGLIKFFKIWKIIFRKYEKSLIVLEIILVLGWRSAVFSLGHPGSSLGIWVLAGFNFEGREGVGCPYPDLPGSRPLTGGLFTCHMLYSLLLTWPLCVIPLSTVTSDPRKSTTALDLCTAPEPGSRSTTIYNGFYYNNI